MNKEEILKAMYDIQCRYTMPYLKQNFTDKDYIILNYENLVKQIVSKQDDLQQENEQLQARIKQALEYIEENSMYYTDYGELCADSIMLEKILKGENND